MPTAHPATADGSTDARKRDNSTVDSSPPTADRQNYTAPDAVQSQGRDEGELYYTALHSVKQIRSTLHYTFDRQTTATRIYSVACTLQAATILQLLQSITPRTKDAAHFALCSLRRSGPHLFFGASRTSRPLMQHTCTQRRSLLTPTYYTHHVTHCRRRENGSLHYTTCRDATPSLRHLLLTHYWRVCSSAVRLPAAPRRSRRHSCKTRNASCNTPEVVSSALATCATHFARHMPRLAARRWLSQLAPWALCCAEALCSTRPLLHTSVVVPLLSSAHAGRMVSNLGKSRLTLS